MSKQWSTWMVLAALTVMAVSPLVAPRGAVAQAQAEARVLIHVDGMHCATCPLTVRTVLRRLSGVSQASVSVENKRATVTYDPSQVSPDRLAKAITDAGYPAHVEGPVAK